jgi:hypothetical protein
VVGVTSGFPLDQFLVCAGKCGVLLLPTVVMMMILHQVAAPQGIEGHHLPCYPLASTLDIGITGLVLENEVHGQVLHTTCWGELYETDGNSLGVRDLPIGSPQPHNLLGWH